MQENRSNRRKKTAPILCALLFITLALVYLSIAVVPLVFAAVAFPIALSICILYGGVAIAVIVGVILALRQRLQELDRGEEDDAKQY